MNESGPTLKGVNVLKCNSQFCAITEKALLRQIGCQNLILYHHHTSKEYYTFSHHWQGSIDFNTVRTTNPTGMYFLIHP